MTPHLCNLFVMLWKFKISLKKCKKMLIMVGKLFEPSKCRRKTAVKTRSRRLSKGPYLTGLCMTKDLMPGWEIWQGILFVIPCPPERKDFHKTFCQDAVNALANLQNSLYGHQKIRCSVPWKWNQCCWGGCRRQNLLAAIIQTTNMNMDDNGRVYIFLHGALELGMLCSATLGTCINRKTTLTFSVRMTC